MSLWAIVPVKPLRKAKSGLSDVLTEDERALLIFTMLSQTLRTLKEVPAIDHILVVSSDSAALAMAREYGARTLQEDGQPDLKIALKRAVVVAKMYNAESLLILSADLPLVSRRDIEKMLSLVKGTPAIVIAPDRHNDGTNAIYMNPPDIIDCTIGSGSYEKNLKKAQSKGIQVELCHLTTLGLDIDKPEDLALLRQIEAFQVDP
ncbi:MAG TPA: 2-phospho-L-lactate guanylyltransferase [Anaerolineaceae bacterium]|nr:MAG: 2-phospho-L-lactate guanylyltransferase [Chloroflexi bacterium GWB2_54_36]HAL16916.1 2-phospho-L-lactate guanylyltransferase [Anaerolineaceae bacterium]